MKENMSNKLQNRKRKSILTLMSDLRLKVSNWIFNKIYYIFVFCLLFFAYVIFCIHYQGYAHVNAPIFFIIEKVLAVASFVCALIVITYLSIISINMCETLIIMWANNNTINH